MSTPTTGVTVITATGNDYTVPSGQSWVPQLTASGDLFINVFDQPFEVEEDGTNVAKGQIIATISDVEAIYPTNSVTKTP
jgi:hypothetical protein